MHLLTTHGEPNDAEYLLHFEFLREYGILSAAFTFRPVSA